MKFLRSDVTAFILLFSYGCFLLSFPNFGPISLKIIEANEINPYAFFSLFYIFHIAGIIFSAVLLDGIKERIKLIKIIVMLLILSSFLILKVYYIISLIGFLMGVVVVSMGSFLARFVEPWKRGKIFALAASLANIYLYCFFIRGSFESIKLLISLSLAPFFLIFLLSNVSFEIKASRINRNFAYFSIPVFVFYLLGGIMYGAMEPVFRREGISVHVLFYAAAIVLAGYLYDAIGRRIVSIFGLLTLSLSFLMFPENLSLSAYLIQLSYAFIDVFAMLIWADISNFGSEARQYGIGMLFITLPIFLGFTITQFFTFQINTILAVSLLIISAFLIGTTKEPLISPKDYIRWISRR